MEPLATFLGERRGEMTIRNVLGRAALGAAFLLAAILATMTGGILLPHIVFDEVDAHDAPGSDGTSHAESDGLVDVYVASNGWHTSLVLPRVTPAFVWDARIAASDVTADASHAAASPWVTFGWGEKEFFAATPQFADFSPRRAIHSLFFSDEFVLQVGFETSMSSSENVRRLRLPRARYLALARYVDSFLPKGADGKARRLQDGYTPHDSFFEAGGDYSLLYTCNTWVADGLRAADVPTPMWAGLASAVMLHLPDDGGVALSAHDEGR